MSIKKGNKLVTIVMQPHHQQKLNQIRKDTNLSNTDIIRRLLEGSDIVWEWVKK